MTDATRDETIDWHDFWTAADERDHDAGAIANAVEGEALTPLLTNIATNTEKINDVGVKFHSIVAGVARDHDAQYDDGIDPVPASEPVGRQGRVVDAGDRHSLCDRRSHRSAFVRARASVSVPSSP
jgi:hypothetical protein